MSQTIKNQPRTGNQTEQEFFAIVNTGRRGVEDMLSTMGAELKAISAPNVGQQFDTWAKRALVYVCGQKEMVPVISNRTGLYSVYQALAKAATMGLQVGGNYPHAYLIPKEGKAVLVVTADGVEFATVHGPGAVLKNIPELHEVYSNDDVEINPAAGTFRHEYHDMNPFKDRGQIVGYFMKLEFNDGRVEIPHITIEEVERIENAYGLTSGPAYQKSRIDMHRKTARKKLLKSATREAEGLAMRMEGVEFESREVGSAPENAAPAGVGDRMASKLQNAAQTMKPASPPAEEEIEVDINEDARNEAAESPPIEQHDLF